MLTIDEVVARMVLPVAYGIAVAATLLLVRHLARRYPSVPARIPMSIRLDGRPSKRTIGRAWLWLSPLAMGAVLALLAGVLAVHPPTPDQRAGVAVVFIAVAETAWLVAWIFDRHIELARKMTYRIAPARMFRACLPVILTTVVAVALSAHV